MLEEEVDALKARRDLNLGLNEERRLQQVRITVEDAARKSSKMEKEV